MKNDITRYVARCKFFQMDKGHSQDIGLHMSLPAWIILGAIYSPWDILRGLQKFSGLFSYMERIFSAKYIHPIFIRKK